MKRPVFVLFMAWFGVACAGPAPAPHAVRIPLGPAARAGSGEADAGQVELDPSLMRDLRITTLRIDAEPIAERLSALGEVVVAEPGRAEVASPVLARVVAVPHLSGDRVRAGDVVAVLASVEVGKARAELLAARARLARMARVTRRQSALAADGAVPSKERETAEADLALAQAEVQAALGTLRALGAEPTGDAPVAEFDQFTLRAPIDGTIVASHAVLGAFAAPGEALFSLGNSDVLWLVAHTFERDAVRVQPGAKVRVILVARPGAALSGTVLGVGPRVDPVSRTLDVRIRVDDPEHLVVPGMTATAELAVGSAADVLAVPLRAVQRVGEAWVVFVPSGPEGHFTIQPIGRGRDLGDRVEVLSGLASGATVVVDGAFLLKAQAAKQSGGGGHDD